MAVSEFLAAVEDEPPSLWTGRARLRLGTALIRAGDWAAAAEVLQRLTSETVPGEGDGGLARPVATSTAEDRGRAGRLLSFVHRHYIRPQAGQRQWLKAGQFPASGLTLREPSGVAASEDGRVVIVDRRSKLAALVNRDGQVTERRSVEDAAHPGWSDGAAYVVTNTRVELPFEGQRTNFLEPRAGKEIPLKGMKAAERGIFGHWFILSRAWKALLSYENRRKGQELLTKNRPEFEDLARDEQGRTYALDRRAKNVSRLSVDRRWDGIVVAGSGWRKPVALDVDRTGKMYVLDRGTRTVMVYDPDGSKIASLGPSLGSGIELRAPADLAVDGTGRLFIADEKLPFVVVLE